MGGEEPEHHLARRMSPLRARHPPPQPDRCCLLAAARWFRRSTDVTVFLMAATRGRLSADANSQWQSTLGRPYLQPEGYLKG